MKKRILNLIFTIILIMTFCSIVFAANNPKERAADAINKAKKLYTENQVNENRSNEIRDLLNNANNLIRSAEDDFRRENFITSLSKANSAIEILNSIPQRLRAETDGTDNLTSSKVQERIGQANLFFEKMKRYDFNNTEILNKFTAVKNKLKFARITHREGKLKQANELIKDAYKILFEIPEIYKKALELHENGVNEIFKVSILAEIAQRYYVQEPETQGEFKQVKYWIDRADRYLQQQDYKRLKDSITNINTAIDKVKEKRKEIDKRKNIAEKECRDAHFMILFAEGERKKSSEQLVAGPMADMFNIARHHLELAKNSMLQKRCGEAYENAKKAAELFMRVKTHRKEIMQSERLARAALKEAEELYKRARQSGLPFDVAEQVNTARANIDIAKNYMTRYEYQKAYNDLRSINLLLKSILR